MLKTNCF